jgi:hypothetical protein
LTDQAHAVVEKAPDAKTERAMAAEPNRENVKRCDIEQIAKFNKLELMTLRAVMKAAQFELSAVRTVGSVARRIGTALRALLPLEKGPKP